MLRRKKWLALAILAKIKVSTQAVRLTSPALERGMGVTSAQFRHIQNSTGRRENADRTNTPLSKLLTNLLEVSRSWNIEKWHGAEIREILGSNAHRALDRILGQGRNFNRKRRECG